MNESQNPAPDLLAMRLAAQANPKPEWTGDLSDDCTAHWAGFVLRAEEMNVGDWWWAVYVEGFSHPFAASWDSEITPRTGEEARGAALRAARVFLGFLKQS